MAAKTENNLQNKVNNFIVNFILLKTGNTLQIFCKSLESSILTLPCCAFDWLYLVCLDVQWRILKGGNEPSPDIKVLQKSLQEWKGIFYSKT